MGKRFREVGEKGRAKGGKRKGLWLRKRVWIKVGKGRWVTGGKKGVD